ncbi:hypothetical protein JCM14467A_05990 [Vulcanisaeta sp. JCM 14467]
MLTKLPKILKRKANQLIMDTHNTVDSSNHGTQSLTNYATRKLLTTVPIKPRVLNTKHVSPCQGIIHAKWN